MVGNPLGTMHYPAMAEHDVLERFSRKSKDAPRRPRSDARISHQPVRRRIGDRMTARGRLTVFSVLAGGLFIMGVAAGTGIGFWLAPTGEPIAAVASVDLPRTTPRPPAPEGSPVPVIVHSSDSAIRVYEENIENQPPDIRPDPNTAPARVEPAPPPVSETPNAVAPMADVRRPETPSVDAKATETPFADIPPGRVSPALEPVDANNWLANAVDIPVDPGRPMIAIVIDDLGVDQPRSRAAIALPAPVTLAFLPYGHNLGPLSADARSKGHELLVHLPMAPLDLGVDPGPNALHKELGEAEIRRRLAWNLSRLDGYIGVNNHMGSRFTSDRDSMTVVLDEIRRRGLIFMDSVTTTETQGYRLAAGMGIPHAVRDVFLDHVIDPDAIRRQLERVQETARRQGYAIAIGHPHDDTLAVLRDWIPRAKALGFQLVPLSAVIRRGPPSARS